MTDRGRYLLDNQQVEAGQRFDALSELFNPSTFRHVESLGISPGWRVWEVGAGGPSVPTWLAGQVAPNGYVLATDIDTTWLDANEARPYDVRRHDVGTESAPQGSFDLVHSRLVLVHVLEREHAITSMVGALRPGGWLFLEEADPGLQELVCPDEWGAEQQLANKLKRVFRTVLSERGADLEFGRTLPRRLREAGLREVQSDAYFPMGGPVCDELERATVEQVREDLVASGLATDDDVAQHLVNVASGRLDIATSPMISAWGQR